MSNDPHIIPLSRVLALLGDLGLDPVDSNTLKRVSIEPGRIEVVRYRLNDDGEMYPVGNEPATETTLIKLGRE